MAMAIESLGAFSAWESNYNAYLDTLASFEVFCDISCLRVVAGTFGHIYTIDAFAMGSGSVAYWV